MATLDFVSDWVEFMRLRLESAGYELPADVSPGKLPLLYFSACQRGVAQRRRRVQRPRHFNCPAVLKAGLSEFTECAERGGSLNRYQSRRITLADKKDLLLFDWGIHHFHLGTERLKKDPRFVARTNDLLFARVTEDTVYILGIAAHGNWARKCLIEIIHTNWPETIVMHRVSATGLERKLTDADHHALQKGGGYVMVELTDGTIYAPPGGGTTSSRDSIRAVRARDRTLAEIKQIEKQAAARVDDWLMQVRQAGHVPADPPRFRLVIQEPRFYALDEGSGMTFPLDER